MKWSKCAANFEYWVFNFLWLCRKEWNNKSIVKLILVWTDKLLSLTCSLGKSSEIRLFFFSFILLDYYKLQMGPSKIDKRLQSWRFIKPIIFLLFVALKAGKSLNWFDKFKVIISSYIRTDNNNREVILLLPVLPVQQIPIKKHKWEKLVTHWNHGYHFYIVARTRT